MSLYLDHFGLDEAPFRITPHTDFFYSGARRGDILAALAHASTHEEGIIVITGEVGSGKTMLCRMLMERLPNAMTIAYLPHPSANREDLLFALAHELGLRIAVDERPAAWLRAIQDKLIEIHGQGRRVVVLIDEAHAMPRECLEEIRLLSNLETNRHKLLQLVLFAQPELEAVLARSDMRQLRDRITQHFRLSPLSRTDVAAYLEFRMRRAGYRGPNPFTEAAVDRIAEASEGLTRRINILADKALLAAYAAGRHEIGKEEATAAIRDARFLSLASRPGPWRHPLALAGFVATLVIVAVVWIRRESSPTMDTPVAPVARETPTPAAEPATTPEGAVPSPSQPSTSQLLANPAPASPPPLPTKIAQSHRRVLALPDERWFIQLIRLSGDDRLGEIERLLGFARRAGLAEEALGVYRAVRGKEVRLGLIYGEYAHERDAVAAIAALPFELRTLRPYPRQVKALKPGPEGWRLDEKE